MRKLLIVICAALMLGAGTPAAASAAPAPATTTSGFTVTALYCGGKVSVVGNNGYNDLIQACIQKGTMNGIDALRPYMRAWVNANNQGGIYCVESVFFRYGTVLGDNSDDVQCKDMGETGGGVNFEDDVYGNIAGSQFYDQVGDFSERPSTVASAGVYA